MPGKTDPREIEGTAERAADRGRSFFDFPNLEGAPYLGDPEVVDGIVRGFVGGIVNIRAAFYQDKIAGEAAATQTFDTIKETAAIFSGQASDYQLMPSWNKPEGVGAYVLKRRGGTMPADQALEALFTIYAELTIEVFDQHARGAIDDGIAKFRPDVNIED
jgi:hypothetical protein